MEPSARFRRWWRPRARAIVTIGISSLSRPATTVVFQNFRKKQLLNTPLQHGNVIVRIVRFGFRTVLPIFRRSTLVPVSGDVYTQYLPTASQKLPIRPPGRTHTWTTHFSPKSCRSRTIQSRDRLTVEPFWNIKTDELKCMRVTFSRRDIDSIIQWFPQRMQTSTSAKDSVHVQHSNVKPPTFSDRSLNSNTLSLTKPSYTNP